MLALACNGLEQEANAQQAIVLKCVKHVSLLLTQPLRRWKQPQSIHDLHVILGYLEALKGSQLIRVLAIVALLPLQS